MSFLTTLLIKAGLRNRDPLNCACGKITPATVNDVFPGEHCYMCGAYRCIYCLLRHPSGYHTYKGYELRNEGSCPGRCCRDYELTEVQPWKSWVDAEIAREALDATAANVRLVAIGWEGKQAPTLGKVLTSDNYDTWEEARYDLKLQAAEHGCREVWWVQRGFVTCLAGNHIYKQWFYTGTV